MDLSLYRNFYACSDAFDDGASTRYILFYAILPNIAAVLATEFTRALSIAILDIAALGFLNLGAQLPSSE